MNDATSGDILLTVSIATWNNRERAEECLRSVAESLRGIHAEIVVVDNASTDGTAAMIHEQFPQVAVLRNERPLGFSANHNQVLRGARGRHVLLLNDDTVIVGDALKQALDFLESHPDAGAVGCTLLRPDGTPEAIAQCVPRPMDPLFPRLRRKVSAKDEAARGAEAAEVERWSGACLMIRRAALDPVGLLDERFDPAYGEDTDLCHRIRRAGWRIYRLPGARVIHYRGQTARREFHDQAYRLQRARILWYRKHRSRADLVLYRAAAVVAIVWGLLSCAVQLPFRRGDTRARINNLRERLRALFL